tara:strand:+ start:19 stop:615 length:597 start_codon:yes stop_codon:yes gene_type:complete
MSLIKTWLHRQQDQEGDVMIIDNFLETHLHHAILDDMTNDEFPWYYWDNISLGDTNTLGKYGFNYWLLKEHETIDGRLENFTLPEIYYTFLNELQTTVGSTKLIRSRVDMTLYRNNPFPLEPHIDLTYPHITTIYYVNHSDGTTILYNDSQSGALTIKEEIEPVANRLVIFDGLTWHTGHTPMKNNRRILINTNFHPN